MRFLLGALVVIGLIVAGYAIETQVASSRSTALVVAPGISVYQIHLNTSDVKTLPEQEAPLP
jgi:hypothetical protein